MNNTTAPFNRCVDLTVIEVINSNPNGDPDMESDPRTMDHNGHGLISPVSYKRKFRDLVEDQDGLVFQEANQKLNLNDSQDEREYKILESRGRNRSEIKGMSRDTFQDTYWDGRIFGNTFLESLKDNELTDDEKKRKKEGGYAHFIRTGTIQVGVGMSVAPVEIERLTMTNKAGVQEDKDRGMAPMGFRVVRHGIYTIPFFVNPAIALKTGADAKDLELFKFLAPLVYPCTTSAIRPQINTLHVWFAEHKSVLGSCPDHLLIEALTPRIKTEGSQPQSRTDYDIPSLDNLADDLKSRFKEIIDLCDAE